VTSFTASATTGGADQVGDSERHCERDADAERDP